MMRVLKQFEKKHNPEIDEKFHQFDIGNIGNVVYWMKFFELTRNVPGDIVECGIGRGRSLLTISALNSIFEEGEGGQRRIYGYDSFQGFPQPTKEDKSFRNPQKGEWSSSPSGKYPFTLEFIKTTLANGGVPIDPEKLILTKGFFNETLKDHPKRPIAILHIDGDLYQSYKSVLENLFDLVSKKGIIVCDDVIFGNEEKDPFPGARLAVKEFFKSEFESFKISIGGSYYYIKMN